MSDTKHVTILHSRDLERNRRFMLLVPNGSEAGCVVRSGPCAKALARQALAEGADSVRHAYDLGLDDCDEHTTRRFR